MTWVNTDAGAFRALAIDRVLRRYGVSYALEQTAEECGELVQACCKMLRVERGTTPVTQEEAKHMLMEEVADILNVVQMLEQGYFSMDEVVEIQRISERKIRRMAERLLPE